MINVTKGADNQQSYYGATFFNKISSDTNTYDIVQMVDISGTPIVYMYAQYWATTLLRTVTKDSGYTIELEGNT